MKRKALLLVEVSVLLIATAIIYMAVTNSMSQQNLVVSRMAENNDVLLILDGFANKVKADYFAGVDFGDIGVLNNYNESLRNSRYRLNLEFTENGNVILVLSVFNGDTMNAVRRYRKEVLLNNE